MRVIIAGAGTLGCELTQTLTVPENDICLIEADIDLAERVKRRLSAKVVRGDACDPQILEEAGALKADVLVAVAGQDQVNLVISLLAKRHFDIPKVVARVNDSDNRWLFTDRWGVDVPVSATMSLLGVIREAASIADTVGLVEISRAGVRLIETTLTADSLAVGKTLSQLELPSGAIVTTVIRTGKPIVPDGTFKLQPDDEILVVTHTATEGDIRKVFQR